jgi:hypothetical protein
VETNLQTFYMGLRPDGLHDAPVSAWSQTRCYNGLMTWWLPADKAKKESFGDSFAPFEPS